MLDAKTYATLNINGFVPSFCNFFNFRILREDIHELIYCELLHKSLSKL